MASPVVSQIYAPGPKRSKARLDVLGRRLVHWLEEQESLDKAGARLGSLVQKKAALLPGGQTTVDFLHGKYVGHPLHPILTDIPVGAFHLAAMFDIATLGRKPSKTATKLLMVGLAAVPITALSGALDWQHTDRKSKRVGMGHAALNSFGSVVLATALANRLRGKGPSQSLVLLGNGILGVSAYLGGHLVFENRIGVKHEAEASPPEYFVAVMAEPELKEQVLTRVEVRGFPIALYKRFGHVYAIADTCPHLGCSLAEGGVAGEAVVCGCHGSRFCLDDGGVLQGPSAFPAAAFTTRVANGMIEVAPRR